MLKIVAFLGFFMGGANPEKKGDYNINPGGFFPSFYKKSKGRGRITKVWAFWIGVFGARRRKKFGPH